MNYKYKFPIGDWSNDGHEQCDWFEVSGDKPIKDVRKAHHRANALLGFKIETLCSKYNEFSITEEQAKSLKSLGINFDFESLRDHNNAICPDTWHMVLLWIEVLNKTDISLNLIIEKEESIPMIVEYGNGIKCPGYGLFDCL